ncbi:hypothetical protein VNI00_000537 [Paramarasmius palmivorus]|uniref:Uncharacterized protein n=1 Tax=Paramarasmius palmivorus TaxID=297713 RepID=A0AAW0E8I1_9AGAR
MTTRQMLKRNISTEPQNDTAFKKPKIRKPLQSQAKYAYETPHPTAQSQSEVYKLPSSVGSHVSPSDFSPIPKPSNPRRGISSTNLKENTTTGNPFIKERFSQKKYGKNRTRARAALESPFGSATASPENTSASKPAEQTDSPTLTEHFPIDSLPKPRRPSAPTPPRFSDWNYNPSNTVSAVDLPALKNQNSFAQTNADDEPHDSIFSRSPSHAIDFNRPPSQLSLYDYTRTIAYDSSADTPMESFGSSNDDFSRNIAAASTPFKLSLPPKSFRSPGGKLYSSYHSRLAVSDTETDSDPCDWDSDDGTTTNGSIFRSLKMVSRSRARSGSGFTTPSPEDSEDEEMSHYQDRSTWVEDSLISAPDTMEWKIRPRNARSDAFMRRVDGNLDVDMTNDEKEGVKGRLEGMFDNLMIASDELKTRNTRPRLPSLGQIEPSPALVIRTRSLGDSVDLPSATSEDNSKCSQTTVGLARRTRSGTVVAPPTTSSIPLLAPALPVITSAFRRTRSGTVVLGKVDPKVGIPEGATATSATIGSSARRTRSGTVVASATQTLSSVEERQGSSFLGQSGLSIPGFSSRRTRSGSVAASGLAPVGETAALPPPVPSRRSRSGSIAALANSVGAKLASIPLPGTGMMHRTRSGTVVAPAPTPVEAQCDDVDMDQSDDAASVSTSSSKTVSVKNLDQPDDSPDPLDTLSSPQAQQSGAADSVASLGARLGLRPRAKSTASKLKGPEKSGESRQKGKGKQFFAWSGNAMDVDDQGSDDELLLKPGDRFD